MPEFPDNLTAKELLRELPGAPLAAKAALIQAIYERVAYSPSGIIYSMQRLVDSEIRPFRPDDFDGSLSIDPDIAILDIEGPWEWLHGENSITNSGIYLASQAYRLQVEPTPAAREQAAKAFHSLELIFEMGVNAGKPGWMNKPYGFRPSNQTSPDQYSDACWGLFSYHAVAPPEHRRKIELMIPAFADYWRSVDYTIRYFDREWSVRGDGGYGNATLLLLNLLAYHFTGREVYRIEVEWYCAHQHWMERSDSTLWRERIEQEANETGQAPVFGRDDLAPFATPLLRPGEVLFWESSILCKYVAVAAEIIQQVQPDLLGGRLPEILRDWWEQGRYGIGEDLLPYYWFAADFRSGTWRPLPSTEPVPPDQWAFGSAFMSRVSQVRWNEPLARSLITSVIATHHSKEMAAAAQQQALRILNLVDETRLHWIVDPDGHQLLPQIRYYGQCLSSEMPATFLAAYWRGRRDGLW